jgi:hypothetical protein
VSRNRKPRRTDPRARFSYDDRSWCRRGRSGCQIIRGRQAVYGIAAGTAATP